MSSDHDQPAADERELEKSATDSAAAAGAATESSTDSTDAGSVAGLGAAPVADSELVEASAASLADSDTAAESGSGTAAESGSGTAAQSGSGTAAQSDSGTVAESGSGTAAQSDSDTAAESDSGTAAQAGSSAAAQADSATETVAGAIAGLATGPVADTAADSTVIDAGAQFAAAASGPADPIAPVEETSTAATVSEAVTVTERQPVHDGGTAPVETIVHVLRHGEVHNPNGILYGRLPGFSLSVAGRSQAGAVARALADHDIAVVIASPLQRAQETAEPIAAQHHLLVRTDENLIEAGNTFEGLRVSVGDGALRKPRHWWKLRDPFTPSWGEPYLQIAHRMLAAVNKARVEAAGREAVLVSHQLPVWTLRRFLQGQRLWHDPRQRQCSLASLTSLVYQGDTLVDIVYSEPAGGSDPSVHGA
ncbi:broad specificity phosphatase PhoE [Nocardia tenerifensis]|uniref:Broad specificity phosphatase PhoE n=1 Tax=Nocardia tenerifensis TaxID=228006 RepID=A0A318K5M4_9NOCA|nr:broad specificity phosphatase PhoE [Nocardia tenerifensis]